MRKLSSMNKARVSSKAKERFSRESMFFFGASALFMFILINEQIRLALLNW